MSFQFEPCEFLNGSKNMYKVIVHMVEYTYIRKKSLV